MELGACLRKRVISSCKSCLSRLQSDAGQGDRHSERTPRSRHGDFSNYHGFAVAAICLLPSYSSPRLVSLSYPPFWLASPLSSSCPVAMSASTWERPPFVRFMSPAYLPQYPRHLPAYPSMRCCRVNIHSSTNANPECGQEPYGHAPSVRTDRNLLLDATLTFLFRMFQKTQRDVIGTRRQSST
jgi:hypothetical protein